MHVISGDSEDHVAVCENDRRVGSVGVVSGGIICGFICIYLLYIYIYNYIYIYTSTTLFDTSSTARGGGGSFRIGNHRSGWLL